VHAQLDGIVAAIDQLLRNSEPTQDLERPRLHHQCARLVDSIQLAINDPDGNAESPKLSG